MTESPSFPLRQIDWDQAAAAADRLDERVFWQPVKPKPRWPDLVLSLAQVLFIVMLLPMFWEPVKPPPLTSFGTAAGLAACSFAVAVLGARWGAVTMAVMSVLWFALGVLRILG